MYVFICPIQNSNPLKSIVYNFQLLSNNICILTQNKIFFIYRNVLHLENATSTEINSNTKEPLIIEMPEHCPENKGGTMRLGKRTTIFKKECSSTMCKYNIKLCVLNNVNISTHNFR